MEIVIRELNQTDNDDIFAIYCSDTVIENSTQIPFLTKEDVKALFDGDTRKTVVAESQGRVIGHVSLFLKTKAREKHAADLAIAVHPEAHGKGVGNALMVAALNLADNWLNLSRLELSVYTDNEIAINLYEKLGFEREGIKRQCTFKNGEFADVLIMARLR